MGIIRGRKDPRFWSNLHLRCHCAWSELSHRKHSNCCELMSWCLPCAEENPPLLPVLIPHPRASTPIPRAATSCSLRAIASSACTWQQPGLRERHVCFAALTQFSRSLERLSAHLSSPHPMARPPVSHSWLKPIFLGVHALQADEAVSELAS